MHVARDRPRTPKAEKITPSCFCAPSHSRYKGSVLCFLIWVSFPFTKKQKYDGKRHYDQHLDKTSPQPHLLNWSQGSNIQKCAWTCLLAQLLIVNRLAMRPSHGLTADNKLAKKQWVISLSVLKVPKQLSLINSLIKSSNHMRVYSLSVHVQQCK